MDEYRIRVAAAAAIGKERDYLLDCMEHGQFSGGRYLARFEAAMAEWLGVKYALATSSGTAALHLALLAAGVKKGDEVIVPDVTFVASANAVRYCGGRPVFVDIEADTWTMDVEAVHLAITRRTKAILAVHLYGAPAAMVRLRRIADEHGVVLIEDAAEALGSQVDGKLAGTLGDMGCFSFYGNKLITTGEGGMVVTNHADLAEHVKWLRGQCQLEGWSQQYHHNGVGYNYRMSEIQAAVGLAQVERVEEAIAARRLVRKWYVERLGVECLQVAELATQPVWWMNVALMDGPGLVEIVRTRLRLEGIETRPVFTPMHTLVMYRRKKWDGQFPQSMRLWRQGVVLPTHAGLTEEDVDEVCGLVKPYLWNDGWR